MDNNRYILISGTGRSGTTIVKEVLSQHPQIGFVKGRETRIFSDPPTVFDLKATMSPFYQDRLVKDLYEKYRLLYRGNLFDKAYGKVYRQRFADKFSRYLARRYQGVSLRNFYPQMMQDLEQLFSDIGLVRYSGSYIGSNFLESAEMFVYEAHSKSINQALKNYIELVIQNISKNKNCIIEDNPFGFYYANDFQETLGERFKSYFILRDPRDIVASSMKTSWAPSELKKCCVYVKKILSDFELYSESLTLLKLEDFIEHPKLILSEMTERIGLDEYEFSIDSVNKKSIGRYKKLSIKNIEYMNDFFSRELKKFDYIIN